MIKLVITTIPKESAEKVSKNLISNKLAGCINIVNGVKSFFYWEGKLDSEEECILFIKTNEESYDLLIEDLKKNHPYDVPEILTIDINHVNESYLNWLNNVLNRSN